MIVRRLMSNQLRKLSNTNTVTSLKKNHNDCKTIIDNSRFNFIQRIFRASSKIESVKETEKKLIQDVKEKNIIWFGEYHSEERVIKFLDELFECSLEKNKKYHVIWEHFSQDMEDLLKEYCIPIEKVENENLFEKLVLGYNDIGTEGHNLEPYKCILEKLRKKDNVSLHGCFIPRPYASALNKLLKESNDEAITTSASKIKTFFDDVMDKKYLPSPTLLKQNQSSCDVSQTLLARAECAMNQILFSNKKTFELASSRAYFMLVQSLFSGRDVYNSKLLLEQEPNLIKLVACNEITPQEKEQPIFKLHQAQLLKDHSAAFFTARLIVKNVMALFTAATTSEDEKFQNTKYFIILGKGHCSHYCGMPELLESYLMAVCNSFENPNSDLLDEQVCLLAQQVGKFLRTNFTSQRNQVMIHSQMLYELYLEEADEDLQKADEEESLDKAKARLFEFNYNKFSELCWRSDLIQNQLVNYSNSSNLFDKPMCDYLFVYDEDDENILTNISLDNVDFKEINDAYNSVGQGAIQEDLEGVQRGNVTRATYLMKHLGYSEEEIHSVHTKDLVNFQGVACPFRGLTKRGYEITKDDCVLDLGCGLGVDSIIAVQKNAKQVVGIDFAKKEIEFCKQRYSENYKDASFVTADIEHLTSSHELACFHDQKFDVAISNGAFCLLPNKQKAFCELAQFLKPCTGRFSICTMVLHSHVKDKSSFPTCVRAFAQLEEIKSYAENAGLTNIQVKVLEQSSLEVDVPEEVLEIDPRRVRIHNNTNKQFQQTADSVVDFCKVVCITGNGLRK